MQAKLTRGGQISIPAEIRHRWRVERLEIEDKGDHLVLRPATEEDPIAAARGAFADPHDPAAPGETWAEYKRENQAIEERKYGVLPNGLNWRDVE